VQINGTSSVTLTAPTPGAASGIPPFAFYQDRNAPATPFGSNGDTFNGGANLNITGAVYFPNQLVTYTGGATSGAGAAKCTQIVSYQVTFSGTTNFNSSAGSCGGLGLVSLGGSGGPSSITLVE